MASIDQQIAWLEAEIKRLKDELKRIKEQRAKESRQDKRAIVSFLVRDLAAGMINKVFLYARQKG